MVENFYTDGRHLYEVIARDIRRNYGLGPTFLTETAVLDVASGDVRFLTGPGLAALEPVYERKAA